MNFLVFLCLHLEASAKELHNLFFLNLMFSYLKHKFLGVWNKYTSNRGLKPTEKDALYETTCCVRPPRCHSGLARSSHYTLPASSHLPHPGLTKGPSIVAPAGWFPHTLLLTLFTPVLISSRDPASSTAFAHAPCPVQPMAGAADDLWGRADHKCGQ